jgi:cysteinyl-tRNA synthetase
MQCDLAVITEKYSKAFFEDIETLNIFKADVYPRATHHIDDMLTLIGILEKKGFAYQKGGSVYFSIEKFTGYGKLGNITAENLHTGSQSDADEYDKNNIQDFVLWKEKKPGEPFWKTKYGDGRPGWHIECSAMSMKYLGTHFDIHMGGVDNIFPHHENEIAQSQCATGKPFVNFWIHCQHLIVEGSKMSKSMGNFYTLRDLISKGYDAMVIRYLLLSTHYRKLLNFTFDGLERAKQSLKRITNFIFSLSSLNPSKGETKKVSEFIEKNEQKFQKNMNNDFNISGSLGVLFEFIHHINLQIEDLKTKDVDNILDYLRRIDSILGVMEQKDIETFEAYIMEKIALRDKARKEKKFDLADSIRDSLKQKGIILIDTHEGVRWKVVKT